MFIRVCLYGTWVAFEKIVVGENKQALMVCQSIDYPNKKPFPKWTNPLWKIKTLPQRCFPMFKACSHVCSKVSARQNPHNRRYLRSNPSPNNWTRRISIPTSNRYKKFVSILSLPNESMFQVYFCSLRYFSRKCLIILSPIETSTPLLQGVLDKNVLQR